MKHALLISGYLRSFKENLTNLKRYLLDGNDIDIFIHITKDSDSKYNNKDINLDDIYTLLNPKYMIITSNFDFNENNIINNIMNQNYKFYLLNEERKRIEEIEKIQYKNVIKIRPDVCLQEKININTEYKIIQIPQDSKIDTSKLINKEDYYLCDIIAYGNAEQMNVYFNFYKDIYKLIEKHGTVNETLLYHYLNRNEITYELVNINYIVILSLCNTIAITGDSGSGKTTVSNILKNLFNNSFILECDRYHKWERGNENWNTITHLNPEANYITKMENDVFNLKIGKDIYQVDYDHKTGQFTDNQVIESKENIIVCGLHCLYLPDNVINLKVYMDTDDNLRIPWKVKRDIHKRGYTIEKIMKQINDRKLDFDTYIYPQREQADLIINFYTDNEFNIDTFDINETNRVFLRIGIKEEHNIKDIITKLEVHQFVKEDKFIFLYFNENYDYETIIKTIILNLK
jgi:uridine kinase